MKKIFLLLFITVLFQVNAQSLRSINLDSYKYIIIDEVSGGKQGVTRRFLVKKLKKAGYNIVNLNNPLKTHDKIPEDLLKNPEIGLYLTFSLDAGFWGYKAKLILYDNNNKELLKRTGESGSLLSKAVKNTISSLVDYDYIYDAP
jgi:hypothetical protein